MAIGWFSLTRWIRQLEECRNGCHWPFVLSANATQTCAMQSQAVSAALDDLDAAEDEELMAAAAAAEGRRRVGRKGKGRGRGKVEEKKAVEKTGAVPPEARRSEEVVGLYEVIHRRRQAAAEKGKALDSDRQRERDSLT